MTRIEEERWAHALASLRKFVPSAADFIPDHIADAVRTSGKQLAWRTIERYDEKGDAEIWRDIKPQILGGPGEQLIVVADACFSNGIGPLEVWHDDMDSWVDTFVDAYSDELFGGDAVFISSFGVLLVHHEGLVTQIT